MTTTHTSCFLKSNFPQVELEKTILFFFLSSKESEDEEISSDPDIRESGSLSSEASQLEIPDTDSSQQELPLVEEIIVIPLEKEEEEHVSSTITLLEREEVLDEDKETGDDHEQQESLNYCSPLPSFSSSCSCVASLQEYLHKQSSALLSKKRKCHTTDRKPTKPPIQTPTWHLPLPPPTSPEPQLHHSEEHRLPENEQASEVEPESGASPSETPQLPGSTTEFHEEPMSEPPVLEPSQTSNLPKPSATDSSSAKPSSLVETPQLSSEEPGKEPRPQRSQDVLAVERHSEASSSVSSSISVKPIVGATVEDSSVASEERPKVDSHPEINTPLPTLDKIGSSQLLPPTTSHDLEDHPDPPPESSTASIEPTPAAPDIIVEIEHFGGSPLITETKIEDLTEDISTSPDSSGQLPRPSSDIYAETPNGTEHNGNPVHGSSQKESVFMRLNNRIKALEMNMSLSGRYLEQLSQR